MTFSTLREVAAAERRRLRIAQYMWQPRERLASGQEALIDTPQQWAGIIMASGEIAVVDLADLWKVERLTWNVSRNGRTSYVHAHGPTQSGHRPDIKLHRLIMNAPRGVQVGHKDGNGLDNRRANLRLATHQQNTGNQKPSRVNTSGYRGVHLQKQSGRFVAYIGANPVTYLGIFDDAWGAAEAYNHAAIERYGEFARLNVRQP